MNRRIFEKKEQTFWENAGYLTIRALPASVYANHRYIMHRADFLNVADLIAFKGNECTFIQVTSSDTDNPADMRRSLNGHKKKIAENYTLSFPFALVWYHKAGRLWQRTEFRLKGGEWVEQ